MINTKEPVGYFAAFKGLAEQVFTVPIRVPMPGSIPSIWRWMRRRPASPPFRRPASRKHSR